MLAAVLDGDVRKLAELMRHDPGFSVNKRLDGDRFTCTTLAMETLDPR